MAIAAGKADHNIKEITPNSIGVLNLGYFCKKLVLSKYDIITGGNIKTGNEVMQRVKATWLKA